MAWFLAAWPPLVFLIVIAVATVVAVRRGAKSSEEAGAIVQAQIPALLASTLTLVGLTTIVVLVLEDDPRSGLVRALTTGWSPSGVGLGTATGIAIAVIYFGGLEVVVAKAQDRFGDYVPAGSTAVLGTGGAAFFVANIILAPVVEEIWYRGLLYDALGVSSGPIAAAIVGCIAFGLFHWPGGAWYVLVTGALVGGACWLLRAMDGSLASPYIAHLTLNVIEYIVLVRRARIN